MENKEMKKYGNKEKIRKIRKLRKKEISKK